MPTSTANTKNTLQKSKSEKKSVTLFDDNSREELQFEILCTKIWGPKHPHLEEMSTL